MNSLVSKKHSTWTAQKIFFLVLFVFMLFGAASKTHAATVGFVTKNGYTYYQLADGSYYKKGWLTLNGSTYYFNKKTGIMFTGWQVVNGQKIRYFYPKNGKMAVGYVTDKKGNVRYFTKSGKLYHGFGQTKSGKVMYFQPGEGIMKKGWLLLGKQYRYFNSKGKMVTGLVKNGAKIWYFHPTKPANVLKDIENYGVMYTSKAVTVDGKTYYFKSTGKAVSGWLTLNNKKYYFDSNCVLQKNQTLVIGGVTYNFDSKGVATVVPATPSVSNKTYTLYGVYYNFPGIADGKIDDATLLAAVADREMGASTLEGMMGICMCILNRSLKENTAFPNDFRQCIFQSPMQFCEDYNGSFAVLQRKLLGSGWANKALALRAANESLKLFDNYVKYGTPRKINGYKTNDFDYIGFMVPKVYDSTVGHGTFNPGKSEAYNGICVFYDCWNKEYGNK